MYNFERMKWNTSVEQDPRKNQYNINSKNLKFYNYLGKTVTKNNYFNLEFTYWKKGDKYYVDVLNTLEEEYLIQVDSLDNLELIESIYCKEDDIKITGEKKDINVSIKDDFIKLAENYDRFDPDLDEDSYDDFFIGSIDSIKEFESDLLKDNTIHPIPIRLASSYYKDKDKDETPKLGVYKTLLSKSFIEFHYFDKSSNKKAFPVFCRVYYKEKVLPVDLKKFIDTNKKLSLGEYIELCEKEKTHGHSLAVLDWFADHLVDTYMEKYSIKIENNNLKIEE